MKKFITIIAALLMTASVFAQAPGNFNYQTVIRDADGQLVANTEVTVKLSILKDSAAGNLVYVSTHTPTTNDNGLVSVNILAAGRTILEFPDIDWSDGSYYIKSEIDPAGGTDYTITGTTQLLSVPYALHANTATSVSGAQAAAIEANTAKTGITTLAIGDAYQGGIIFWLDETGQHGLIAATEDQSAGVAWSGIFAGYTGTSGDGLYAGEMNTTLITAIEISAGTTTDFAAKICADYEVMVGDVTYGDWYLPSLYELTLLEGQKDVVGNFESAVYWSSTEHGTTQSSSDYAKPVAFDGITQPDQGDNDKDATNGVRAIRSF